MPYITPELRLCSMVCFTTKRNYTTLKQADGYTLDCISFTTKRNYTTLKLYLMLLNWVCCFTTKRNYTTLKPQIHEAKSTMLLPNRVISVDISAKTA